MLKTKKISINIDLDVDKKFLEYLFKYGESFICGLPQCTEMFIREYFNRYQAEAIGKRDLNIDKDIEYSWDKFNDEEKKKIIEILPKKKFLYDAMIKIKMEHKNRMRKLCRFNINKDSSLPGECPISKKEQMTWGLDKEINLM